MGLNRRYIMRRKINEPRIVEEAVEKVEFKEEALLQQIQEVKSETIQSEVIEHDDKAPRFRGALCHIAVKGEFYVIYFIMM